MDSPWTQDYKFSSTGYERNDHFIQEGYVEYTQVSLGEQRFPDDFDYDDVTISKTLLDACRRQADHSEEQGQSSCVSSSVSLIERWDPLWNRLTQKFKVFEKFRATAQKVGKSGLSWSRHREQILADCQAEIRKHEIQAFLTEEVDKN